MAFTYEISGLGKLAGRRFQDCIWATGFCQSYDFVETLRRAYAGSPNALSNISVRKKVRWLLVNIARAHASQLLAPGRTDTALAHVVRSTPEPAYDLMVKLVSKSAHLHHPATEGEPTTPTAAVLPRQSASFSAENAQSITANSQQIAPPTIPAPRRQPTAANSARETSMPRPTAASTHLPPSRKRKRAQTTDSSQQSGRETRNCTICEGKFTPDSRWSRDDIYTRQYRTCADQLERRINFDSTLRTGGDYSERAHMGARWFVVLCQSRLSRRQCVSVWSMGVWKD